ncbi:hypothetical protein FQV39_20230 [Bosea sp. F3-2]|uniref:hypothetical protein n=1 Tax=Bosea sp. F3-2 TaxID=2599640 RepID=UPI0011EF2E93|nr:hypothetical protein [Bosea sp. F3-2]QEL24652.1 hypothetical protein FQV39_20230 [Bosea sp. F3-2]
MLIGAFVLAYDELSGWREITPLFRSGFSFRDSGYIAGSFGAYALGGYLTALASKRGLRKAIDADRKPSSARPRAPMPDSDSLQREYSIS